MRFGIMSMQTEALIPPDLPAEDLLASVAEFDHADLARRLFSRGFDPIEIGGDMALFLPHTMAPPTIQRFAALREETGLTYTVHLPLWSIEPSTPFAPVRDGSVQVLVNAIQATLPLEPENYVLHATGPLAAEFSSMSLPQGARQFVLRLFQGNARQSIQSILAETGIPSRQLAIETIEFPLELTLELAEEMDLSLCLDIGHILAGFSGPAGLFEVLEQVLPRLAEVHLHDAPWQGPERVLQYGQDHRPLGTGDLEVERLLDRLEEVGFTGPLIFELTEEEALASLEVIRALRPQYLA